MKTFIIVKSLLGCAALGAALLVGTTTYAVFSEDRFSGGGRTFEHGAKDDDDGAANIQLTGYWDDIIEGSPVSGGFVSIAGIEPSNISLSPVNTSGFTISGLDPSSPDHPSYTDARQGSKVTTDGETNHIADLTEIAGLQPDADPIDGAAIEGEGRWLSNFQSEIDSSAAEVFYLFDNTHTRNSTASRAAGMPVNVSSGLTPLLDSLDLAQTLDWYDVSDPENSAPAYLEIGAVSDEERSAVSAWVDVSEFDFDIKDVPGPSPLVLLGLGVFGLLFNRVRRNNYRSNERVAKISA